MKEYIKARLAGSTQQYISLKELRNISILFPNQYIINNFKMIIKSIYEKIKVTLDEEEKLMLIRDALLPKLMSEQIRI